MDELFQACVAFAILLVLLSVLVTIPTGRLDPLLCVRPVGRYLLRLPARACRQASRLCYHWARASWRQAGRSPWYTSAALATLSAALGFGGFLFSIPADILGAFGASVKKS